MLASIRSRSTGTITFFLSIFGIMLLVPLFFVPVGAVLSRAFFSDGGRGRFTFATVRSLLASSYIWRIISFTLLQALFSTAAALLIGLPGAFLLSHYRFRGRFIIRAVSSIPFVLPSIIVVLGFVVFFGNNGYLNTLLMQLFRLDKPPLRILYTFKAIILAHGFYNFPIVLSIVAGYWEQVSDNTELAAYSLGSNRIRTFFTVTLPKIYPAIFSSAALVFLFCFTSFAIILVLGGGPQFTTIEVEIFRQARVSLDMQSAAGLAIISVAVSSVILLLYILFQSRMRSGTAGFRLSITAASGITSTPAGAARIAIILYIIGIIVLAAAPIASVVLRSFQAQPTRGAEAVFSLKWYRQLFAAEYGTISLTAEAFKNSFIIAVSAVSIAIPAAVGLSYITKDVFPRKPFIPELLFMMPLAVSSIILGLGYFFLSSFADRLPIDRLLMVGAHAIITLPFILRSVLPALQNMRPSYTAASLSLGAGPARTFFSIELPMLKNAVISGAVFAVAISLGEINATLMLAAEQTITIPLLLYRLIGSYNFYAACAVGTLLILLCTGLFSLFEYLRDKL